MNNVQFRYATENDAALVLEFIKGIATYEKMLDEVVNTEELIKEVVFGKGNAEVIFALDGEKEVGFALFFHNYSTFVGRAGIHLEDLFVWPEYRGKGYGKALCLKSPWYPAKCCRILQTSCWPAAQIS